MHFNVPVRGIPAQNNIEFELICRLRSSSGINVVIDISSLVWASHLRTIIFLTYPVQYKKIPLLFFTDFSSTCLRANLPTIEKSHLPFFFSSNAGAPYCHSFQQVCSCSEDVEMNLSKLT